LCAHLQLIIITQTGQSIHMLVCCWPVKMVTVLMSRINKRRKDPKLG
jgi:hypothetical protein